MTLNPKQGGSGEVWESLRSRLERVTAGHFLPSWGYRDNRIENGNYYNRVM